MGRSCPAKWAAAIPLQAPRAIVDALFDELQRLGPRDARESVANVPRTATAVTTSPVRALVLTRGAFLQLIKDNPPIAAKVLALLGDRVAAEAI